MPDIITANPQKSVSVQEIQNRNKQRPLNVKIADGPNDALDKNSFLKLLVTQLSKQDPLNPTNDREFIAQMAQFSSLEQMSNVANSMDSLKSFQASTLTGKTVSGKDFVSGRLVSGVVNEVIYDSQGQVFLRVNGRSILFKDLTSVSETNVSRETIPAPVIQNAYGQQTGNSQPPSTLEAGAENSSANQENNTGTATGQNSTDKNTTPNTQGEKQL